MIYVISTGETLHKVGVAESPLERLRVLQTGWIQSVVATPWEGMFRWQVGADRIVHYEASCIHRDGLLSHAKCTGDVFGH